MNRAASNTQSDLVAIAGELRVSTEPERCADFAVDGITPKCVVFAASAEEVAETLRCAAARNLAVIPCGYGTKLGVGASPRRYDLALCLRDMNRVTYYEPDDLVASVEPGLLFGDFQDFLGGHKLWLPFDPAGGRQASLGGILAANSAGPLRLRYGGPRDVVLGIKIATTDGKIVKTGGRVVKNVAGYDLGKLLIGSYGTLGVIVEATFKLYPQVRRRATWAIEIETPAMAREFRRKLVGSPLHPLRAVLLNATAHGLLGRTTAGDAVSATPAIWIEAGGSEQVMARYEIELGKLAGALKVPIRLLEPGAAAEAWERVADFSLAHEQQAPVMLRASLPIAGAEDFLERAEKAAETEGCEVAGVAQLGVGVVELGLVTRAASPEPRVPSPGFIGQLRQATRDLGGSLVVTRCPAGMKSKIDVWGPPDDDFEVMHKLKVAWDPEGTLSPGRFVGGL